MQHINSKRSIFSLKPLQELEMNNNLKKTDSFLSIAYIFYQLAIGSLYFFLSYQWKVFKKNNISTYIWSIDGFIINILLIGITLAPIFIILWKRKQKFESIGIKNSNIVKSITIGILGSLPVVLLIIVNDLLLGESLNTRYSFLFGYLVKHLIFVGLFEEIIFTGYFQSRFLVLFKKKWLGIVVVGLIFSIGHMPYQLMRTNTHISEYFSKYWIFLISTTFLHVIKTLMYLRSKNIITPAVFHGLTNFSYLVLI